MKELMEQYGGLAMEITGTILIIGTVMVPFMAGGNISDILQKLSYLSC